METAAPSFEVLGQCLYLPPGKELRRAHHLSDTCGLTGDEKFAEVAVGWNERGLVARIEVETAHGSTNSDAPRKGDAVELFIDTGERQHHVFMPKESDRTEKGYCLNLQIEIEEIEELEKIDFSYRISRGPLGAQSFTCCENELASLWLES